MPKDYYSEQFWKLYEKLPQELKDALWSEENGTDTYNVCQKYEILENLGEVVDLVGKVLIGLLPPEDFPEALEKEIKLKKDVAKRISQEINRFIFFPVKESLANLYRIETAPTPGAPPIKPVEIPKPEVSMPETAPSEVPSETPSMAEEKPVSKKPDTYREPIE